MNKSLDEAMMAIQTENKNLRRILTSSIAHDSSHVIFNSEMKDVKLSSATQKSPPSKSFSRINTNNANASSLKRDNITRITDQIQFYHQKIKNEKNSIASLNQQISETQSKIFEQRKIAGTNDRQFQNAAGVQKHIKLYEKRLNQALAKFNEKVALNKQLRKRIDDVKQERVVFDGIYKKLEREIHKKSKEMHIVMEEGESALIERDRVHAELVALQKRADSYKKDFEQEWKKLGQLIQNDKLIQQQESFKNKTKNTIETPASTSIIGNSNESESSMVLGPSVLISSSESIEKGVHHPPEEEPIQHSFIMTEKQMEEFDVVMQRIKETTGLVNMDDIITKYLETEEKNFSLFNYVTHELNSEIELLENQLLSLNKEIEEVKGKGVRHDSQKKKNFKKLDEKRKLADTKTEEYKQRYESASKTFDQIQSIVTDIFAGNGYIRPISEVDVLRHGEKKINESNIIQYLSMIERRTVEIMQTHIDENSSKSEILNTNSNDTNKRENSISKTQTFIDLPSADDFSSGEESDQEDDERPLTREELQFKTIRGLKTKSDRSKKSLAKKKSTSFLFQPSHT